MSTSGFKARTHNCHVAHASKAAVISLLISLSRLAEKL